MNLLKNRCQTAGTSLSSNTSAQGITNTTTPTLNNTNTKINTKNNTNTNYTRKLIALIINKLVAGNQTNTFMQFASLLL